MARILKLADVHLGVQNKHQDIMLSLECVREYAKEHSIDKVIILGDLFHDRFSIDIESLCLVKDFFKRCKDSDQEWIVFPGNHDMFLKNDWTINSLKPFEDSFTIIDTIKAVKIHDVRYFIIPFITSEIKYMEILKKIETKVTDDDILLTHIGVTDAVLNSCFLIQHWNAVNFTNSKFKQVFTGHFHCHQVISNKVVYPGSLIPFKFDEGNIDHGFLDFDTITRQFKLINILDCCKKYFPDKVPPPQYLTISSDDIETLDNQEYKGSNIRISLEREMTDNEKSQLSQKLEYLDPTSVRFMPFKDLKEQMQIAKKEDVNYNDPLSLFNRFVDADKKLASNLDPILLRKLNEIVVAEGDERYLANLTD